MEYKFHLHIDALKKILNNKKTQDMYFIKYFENKKDIPSKQQSSSSDIFGHWGTPSHFILSGMQRSNPQFHSQTGSTKFRICIAMKQGLFKNLDCKDFRGSK